jgi:hypothetical protein
MRTFTKILIIVVFTTILRIVTSCCNCENVFFSFNYETLQIGNIDNSGQWSRPTESNDMSKNGVAFEVSIIGKSIAQSLVKPVDFWSFNTAVAQSCDCDDRYVGNQLIKSVKIITIHNLNADYTANEEVTPLFLANNCLDCDDIGTFYITIPELIKRLNPESIYNQPVNKFLIYLKVPVENTKAQFQVEVELTDGRRLTAQTALINIV